MYKHNKCPAPYVATIINTASAAAAGTTTTRINQTSNNAPNGGVSLASLSLSLSALFLYEFAFVIFFSFLFHFYSMVYFLFSSFFDASVVILSLSETTHKQHSTFDGTRKGVNTNTTLTHTNKQTNKLASKHMQTPTTHIHILTYACMCTALLLLAPTVYSALLTVSRAGDKLVICHFTYARFAHTRI